MNCFRGLSSTRVWPSSAQPGSSIAIYRSWLSISPLCVISTWVLILGRHKNNTHTVKSCSFTYLHFVPQQQFELLNIITPLCQDVPLWTRSFMHTDILKVVYPVIYMYQPPIQPTPHKTKFKTHFPVTPNYHNLHFSTPTDTLHIPAYYKAQLASLYMHRYAYC